MYIYVYMQNMRQFMRHFTYIKRNAHKREFMYLIHKLTCKSNKIQFTEHHRDDGTHF